MTQSNTIPFVIIWKNNDLFEYFGDNFYSCVNKLNDIDDVLYEILKKIIQLYKKELNHSIYSKELNWNKFCEIINNEPYNDNIFFDINYFDIKKKWNKYDVDFEQIFNKLID